MKRVSLFTKEGKELLGFDTGLNEQAFAQAKAAQFLTQHGCIVFPDASVKPWTASGVEESTGQNSPFPKGNMIISGEAFGGVSLLSIMEKIKKDDKPEREEAFFAVYSFLRARIFLEQFTGQFANQNEYQFQLFSGAAGVFVMLKQDENFPLGTVFFAPDRIVKRCLEAQGDEELESANQWIHPDLYGAEGVSFAAAAMLYAVFSGEAPFKIKENIASDEKTRNADGSSLIEKLRMDIREGVYMPPEFAAPGLDKNLCVLINETLENKKQKTINTKRPSPLDIFSCIENREKTEKYFSPLTEEEIQKISLERENYRKSKDLQVKTRRFIFRNASLLTIGAAALIVLILSINGAIKRQAEKPSTRGMSPAQVAEAYYGAFGSMDHVLMEACVLGRAGKDDINMVVNLYVITKVRGAYEANVYNSAAAQEWLDAGMPETEMNIFGVTDLKIRILGGSESQGEVIFEAEYRLWVPAGFIPDDSNAPPAGLEELRESRLSYPPPVPISIRDRLMLVMHRNAWRISEINRNGL